MKKFLLPAFFILSTLTTSWAIRPSAAAAASCESQYFRQGSTGGCVRTIQKKLNWFGCSAGPIDGDFGSVTANAARNFQRTNNLAVDGVVGPQTWWGLNNTNSRACAASRGDNDRADRRLCTSRSGRCILIHQVLGLNYLELYSGGRYIDSIRVNTGMKNFRTRNTTTSAIFNETFNTEASERITRARRGVDPKQWRPGVRQIVAGEGETGLMGDPHKFNGGQAIHWRVAYSSRLDENRKSIPVLSDGLAQENLTYTGGYASHGCVHTPKSFLAHYDGTFFQAGVRVIVQDQPAN